MKRLAMASALADAAVVAGSAPARAGRVRRRWVARVGIGAMLMAVLCGALVAPANAVADTGTLPQGWQSGSPMMMWFGTGQSVGGNPLTEAQLFETHDRVNNYTGGFQVSMDRTASLPQGWFFLRSSMTGQCYSGLSSSTPAVGTKLTLAQCDLSGTAASAPVAFWLTPSFRPGGYILKLAGSNTCVGLDNYFMDRLDDTSPAKLVVQNCGDFQDSTDPFSSPGTVTHDAENQMVNFFPIDSNGTLHETTDMPTPFASKLSSNKISVCNWGSYTLYYTLTGTITSSSGTDSAVNYQSGTVTGGTCSSQTLDPGFINVTVTDYLQMEGAGAWAAAGAVTFVGWNADATVHAKGTTCNNWGWATARSTNDTQAIDNWPGTSCLTDQTNGYQATPDYWLKYILGMAPWLGLDINLESTPTSIFSGLPKTLGLSLNNGLDKIPGGNYYKNIAALAYHYKAGS